MRAARLTALTLALALAACGGSGDEGSTGKSTSGCGKVNIGKQDPSGGDFHAEVVEPKNVDCGTARTVVGEWGKQQIGGGDYDAKLPAGWECDGSSLCTNGDASVTLTIVVPE